MRSQILALLLCLTGCAHASELGTKGTSIEPASDPACSYDLGSMMGLNYEEFENDLDGGWRQLGNTPGCEAETAKLIRTYRTEIIEEQQRSLLHHEAQLLGAAGDYEAAAATLRSLVPLVTDPLMRHYHEAELAFFLRDRSAIEAARESLAALPQPDWFEQSVQAFEQAYPGNSPPVWPVNLDVVDGLIRCFEKPYAEAYQRAC